MADVSNVKPSEIKDISDALESLSCKVEPESLWLRSTDKIRSEDSHQDPVLAWQSGADGSMGALHSIVGQNQKSISGIAYARAHGRQWPAITCSCGRLGVLSRRLGDKTR